MSDEIYKKYNSQLFKWYLSKTHNYIDAEDLLQEINYQLVLTLSKDIVIVDEERFIWKIAYYTWCKMAKKYIKAKEIVSMTSEMENILSDNFDITKQVEIDEVKDVLLKCISKLNDMTKKCVILYYYEDLSIKEISNMLNIKDSLVKYYLFQARKKIRSELENENIN